MRNDQYFKHDATAALNLKLSLLLESEGAAGYGIYWLLIEFLRMQSSFRLPLSLLGTVARNCHTKLAVVLRVVHDYDLFVIEEACFYSPGLNKRLRNFLESSGAKVEQTARSQNAKPQEISEKTTPRAHVEEKRREEKKKRYCSSSREKTAAAAVFSDSDSKPEPRALPRCEQEPVAVERATRIHTSPPPHSRPVIPPVATPPPDAAVNRRAGGRATDSSVLSPPKPGALEAKVGCFPERNRVLSERDVGTWGRKAAASCPKTEFRITQGLQMRNREIPNVVWGKPP